MLLDLNVYFQHGAIQNNFTTDQKSESPLHCSILCFIEKVDDLVEVLKESREKLISKINQLSITAGIWEVLVPILRW